MSKSNGMVTTHNRVDKSIVFAAVLESPPYISDKFKFTEADGIADKIKRVTLTE